MDCSQVLLKLTSIFHDVFDDEDLVLKNATTAEDVPGWDSLTHVRLILTIERAFRIKFSASEISNLKNVGDLVKLIQAKA